ncbi:MAG: hypothetical protein QOI11_1660 [Candidatus Eremiobacteraeota bacterium]|jgi:hypothetical protein|nr:hypothetical protein [Candidatus Eremiobacteraeota bacterium]
MPEAMAFLTAEAVLGDVQACHLVQLYGGDSAPLVRNAGRYLADGLSQGEAAVAIATEQHLAGFRAQVEAAGVDAAAAVADGRLVFLDAEQTLSRLLADGQPDATRFERVIGGLVDELLGRCPAGVRAYGEMVGLLWEATRFRAAVALEELWNERLREGGLRLFCGYPIDVWAMEFSETEVHGVLCAHSHLVPSRPSLRCALERAMDEVLGAPAAGVRSLAEAASRSAWAILPTAEATILWLRRHLPEHSEAILARTREYVSAA